MSVWLDFFSLLTTLRGLEPHDCDVPSLQADGSIKPEPRMSVRDAADAVLYMASLPPGANVLQMTVMATNMPFVGRG